MKKEQFELEIFIGGYGDYNYRLLRNDSTLIYWKESIESTESKQAAVVHPTGKQWERFWKFMIQCRSWKKVYKNDLEVYGIEWEVIANKKFTDIRAKGRDMFPVNFEEFINEVRLLIPGKEFGYALEYQPEWFEAT